MVRLVLLLFCLILIPCIVFAQAGNIGVFSDPFGCDCDGVNAGAGFLQIHVVHGNFVEATGCQFSVAVYGTPLTYVGYNSDFNVIGDDPQTGFGVSYGSCKTSGVNVMTITYIGVSAACDMISVVADPTAVPPGIYMTDCATPTPNLLTIPVGGVMYVNNDGSCPCQLCGSWCVCLIPVKDTTWGQVKALFR